MVVRLKYFLLVLTLVFLGLVVFLYPLMVPPFLLLVRLGTWGSSLTAPDKFEAHINSTARSCYFHLRNIARLRSSLTPHSILPFLFTHLSPLASITVIPFYLIYHTSHKLQLIQNSAARIITRTPSLQHITSSLQQHHWLEYCQISH